MDRLHHGAFAGAESVSPISTPLSSADLVVAPSYSTRPYVLADVTVTMGESRETQIERIRSDFAGRSAINVGVEGTDFIFRCRLDTTDMAVIFDTFHITYHVPPGGLAQGSVIVDLGSNIGCTLVHYDRLFKPSRLIGVEMDRDNWVLAQHNTRLNATPCDLVHAAIWPETSEVTYGGAEAWGYQVTRDGARRVKSVSMPDLLRQHDLNHVDFLKIDIEGGEKDLLTGDLSWLDRMNRIYVEVHYDRDTLERTAEIFRSRGFRAEIDKVHWTALQVFRG